MKTSPWWYAFFFLLGGIAMVAAQNMLFVKATAQPPAAVPLAQQPAGINVDSRGVNELRADGTIVQRTVDGRVLQMVPSNPGAGQAGVVAYPMTSGEGHSYYVASSFPDPETAKLMSEEMQATQAAQKVLAELRSADSEGDKEKIKAQLREKLLAIFELQQKRRAAEVTKIEQRLAKLKDTMKKREGSKEAIVDRRLDLLTGGVDELGWEETFPLGGPNAANRTPNFFPYGVPAPPVEASPGGLPIGPPTTSVPRPANVPALPAPSFAPPATPAAPAPPPLPVAPRAEAPAATPAVELPPRR